MTVDPKDLIERPDGSFVLRSKLAPRDALADDLIEQLWPQAEVAQKTLDDLKCTTLTKMDGYRQTMLDDYEVKVGGTVGNLTLRSVNGRRKVEKKIATQTTFGPELEAAKALIDEFIEQELDGSKETIHAIVTKVFKVNAKGRVDTHGILGLREHRFDDPIWQRAMDAIEDAIERNHATTYVNFYDVDPDTRVETRLPLSLAKA